MQLTPTIAIHMTFALAAVVLGPFALWTLLRATVRPRWHRAFGYAWVTCMLGAAFSALFIRDDRLPKRYGSCVPLVSDASANLRPHALDIRSLLRLP